MSRTLTASATTEKNKTNGAFYHRILAIEFGGATGTKYYAEELLHGPVPCEGRIVDWGQMSLSATPGKVGGFDQLTITFEDSDRSLRSLFETFPGVQNKLAYVYMWFEGTDWDTDKIPLFAGVLSTPLSWSDQSVLWSISMKGLQEYFDKSIGHLIKQQDFSEVNCSECDGKIIPIVYGNPCRRVPACVIDRPGQGYLGQTFGPLDNALFIHDEAAKLYFTYGSAITLVVGTPGNYETVTGSFSSATTKTFTITDRSSWLASGTVSGIFATGGDRYVMINEIDLDDPSISRGGYPLWLNNGTGWRSMMVTYWSDQGSQIAIVQEPPDYTVDTSTQYVIGATPGFIPNWTVGTPVYEIGDYTYLLNYLPSKEVVRLEARGKSNAPGGGDQVDLFMEYSSSAYSVNLNNKAYNSALGRESGDDGVTTVTISSPPAKNGFSDNKVYATIKGIMNTDGDAMEDPAEVIKHLLTNEFLGNISTDFIDSSSFTDAASSIVTKFAFAIQEEKKLNELVSNLAQQANSLLFWDQGKASLKFIETSFSDHQLALTPSNVRADSIKVEMTPDKDLPTEMIAKFKQAIPSPEQRLSRTSDEAVTNFKEKKEEIDLWGYQLPTSVAKSTENWLAYKLLINRIITISTFLNGLHLQPGDVVILNYADGNGDLVFDGLYGRIRAIRHTAANIKNNTMEEIQLTIETNLWDFTINTATPLDEQCSQPVGVPQEGGRGEVPWPIGDLAAASTTAAPSTTAGVTTTCIPNAAPDSWDVEISNAPSTASGDCVGLVNGTHTLSLDSDDGNSLTYSFSDSVAASGLTSAYTYKLTLVYSCDESGAHIVLTFESWIDPNAEPATPDNSVIFTRDISHGSTDTSFNLAWNGEYYDCINSYGTVVVATKN